MIDGLVLLGASRFGGGLEWPEAARQARDRGLSAVVCAPAMPPDRDLGAAARQLLALQRRPTDTDPDVIALARIDPRDEGAEALADGWLQAGARGIFLHPWEETYQLTDTAVLAPVMRLAARHGVPVVVEAGYPWLAEPAQVGRFAARFPEVSILATRGGHMNMSGLSGDAALRALRDNANLHVTTSGVYRQDWLENVVAEVGASRLVYASLAPALDPRLELARVMALPLEDADRAAVLGQNAARLFSG